MGTAIRVYLEDYYESLKKVRVFGYAHDRSLYVAEKCVEPKYSQSIRNHSPDGFNWGYLGSGCSQTALAILLELLSRDVAQNMYQQFKMDFVAHWKQGEDFDVTINLYEWIEKQLTENNYHKE